MSEISLIGDKYDVDMSIIKMEQAASHLVGLLRYRKISRSELAKQLGWSKSRVTRVLSGDVNLTIKTITTITEKLGYDFDIIFHNCDYEKPKQPWQVDREKSLLHSALSSHSAESSGVLLELQTGEQVVDAVLAGKERELYLSVMSIYPEPIAELTISITPQLPDIPAPNMTYIKQNSEVVCYE